MRRAFWLLLLGGVVFQGGTVWAEVKLGYIDSEALREKLPEFKAAKVQLDRLRQQYDNEATDRQAKLMKLKEDFRKQELLLSEARKTELQAQFEEQERQLQEFTQRTYGPDGELMKKNAELSAPIFEKINTALQELAKEDGYDFIFDVAVPNSPVVYAPERYDLTEKLLERLKEEEKPKQEGVR